MFCQKKKKNGPIYCAWRSSLHSFSVHLLEEAIKGLISEECLLTIRPQILFLSLPSRLQHEPLTVTWVISHCPLLHYYVISCGSVCLIPDSFRSISRRLPTKWLFRRGGTGRRGACPCSPIGAINHSAERVPLCWVLIDHTWTEQLQQKPQLVDVRGRIIHCICKYFFFKSESVVCEKPKCTSSGPNDWFIDFRFVLFCFQFNCRLQCSTKAQIIIQNSGAFQKTLNLAICSTQIAVIVIISLFAAQC